VPDPATDAHRAAGRTPPADTLHGELLAFYARMGAAVPVLALLSMGLLAYIATLYVDWQFPVLWWSIVCLLVSLRGYVFSRLGAYSAGKVARGLRIAIVLSALNAVLYSSVLVFFPAMQVEGRLITSLVLVGLCTGAMSASAGYLPVYTAYVVCMMGGLAIAWFVSPREQATWAGWAFAGMLLLYGVFLMMGARNAFRTFRESFDIRQEQLRLNRRLQSALRESEQASRAKTRFLASASHDLRQPIHTLSLLCASLSMRELDQRTREIANHLNASVKALGSQLDALLDVSKLDAGIVKPELAELRVHALLRGLHGEYEPLARDKGLGLYLECNPHQVVTTDAFLLERILRNLLSNAIKYSDEGDIRMVCEPSGERVRISVIDAGRGIPASERARVFEEFYQLGNPERDRTKGLGLGLAIVKRLCRMLDIMIAISAPSNGGTCFELELPPTLSREIEPPMPEPAMSAQTEPDALTRAHDILVIDDEHAVRQAMQNVLEAMGHQVRLADSTTQAVSLARTATPSLVLADLRLRGDDDGIAAVRAVRAVCPAIPALLISGDTAPDRLKEAQRAGLKLLHKPVDAATLDAAIDDALSS